MPSSRTDGVIHDPVLWRAAFDQLFECVTDWVALVSEDGVLIRANDAALASLGVTRDAAIGQTMLALLPETIAQERAGLYRECAAESEPVCAVGYIGGTLMQCNLRPFETACGRRGVLCVSHPIPAGREPTSPTYRRMQTHDMGPLARLTEREIEVLRHIGQGLTTAQIAKAMHRSVKTIEWHRVSLGNKLEASNRVELARIAIRLGLTSVHADGHNGHSARDGGGLIPDRPLDGAK